MARSPSIVAAGDTAESRLAGAWLLVARVGCLATMVFSLVLFVPGLGTTYQRLQSSCVTDAGCLPGQLTTAQTATLHGMGISLAAYALFETLFTLLIALVWFVVATVVLWRKSSNWMVLLIAAQAFTQGASGASNVFQGSHLVWDEPAQVLGALNTVLLFCFLALFPSGRFAPRWMVAVLIPAIALSLVTSFVQLPGDWLALSGWLLFILITLSLVIAQVYRYLRISNPLQRQQTKWVVFALALAILGQVVAALPILVNPTLAHPTSLYFVVVNVISNVLIALCAVAFAFAILRYRLYDIDVIIRRTLVYGSLTVILALVYVAGVVGVQALLNTITRRPDGTTSPVLVVVTTLLIAALFQPLRRRIQRFIDKRFYRSTYDSRKTLETFGAMVRQEVDLTTLTGQLVTVVHETMQPEHVSFWLRDNTRKRQHS